MPFGRCRDCTFFKRVTLAHPDGKCMRHAPRPGDPEVTMWPPVMADDGCGDFEFVDKLKEYADYDPIKDPKPAETPK